MNRLLFGMLIMMGLTVMQASAAKPAGVMDTDADGKVTKDEFFAARSKQSAEKGKELKKEASDALFAKRDTNGDGVLTMDELTAKAEPAAAK
jgi:Ca2+-binding EF-hand superfamily protein